MSIGIEVNIVFVKKHETLRMSNGTRFTSGTVLPSGYNIPRMKFSHGALSTTNAESMNVYSAILSL